MAGSRGFPVPALGWEVHMAKVLRSVHCWSPGRPPSHIVHRYLWKNGKISHVNAGGCCLNGFCLLFFAVLQAHFCILLPFLVRLQTRGWVTRCVPAQVSPAAPAPSLTRPLPPTPTERSTGGRKVPATSRLTGSRAPLKVRVPRLPG